MNSALRMMVKVLLPLLVIGVSVGVAGSLIRNRPKQEKKAVERVAPLVKVVALERATHRLDVRAQGTVEAARTVNVTPQVSGRITSVSDALVAGGRVSKGDVLFRIDSRDYAIALKEREAAIKDAEARLRQEKGQQEVARREWALFQKQGAVKSDASLALREPQLEIAQLSLETAKIRKESARLNVSRTVVKAPFNAIVRTESAEPGQVVGTQGGVATLIGTDAFWVRAAVPIDELSRIAIPNYNAADGEGSVVTVEQDLGQGAIVRRQGRVIRLLGSLDPVGRLAQVLVEVKDPLSNGSILEDSTGTAPLLIDAYVSVVFGGSTSSEYVEVPRAALRDGDSVWVVNGEDELEIRKLEVAWRRPESVLVSSGVVNGERVIVSKVGAPAEGMKLRTEAAAPGGEQ
jgi:RND family efflux transporter MFP subunit